MTRSDDKREDAFLESLFAAERQARGGTGTDGDSENEPAVSPEFLARVIADAEAVQAGFAAHAVAPPPSTARRSGIWQQIGAAIGGWPAVAGLAAASAAGLWLGISPPAGLGDVAATYVGADAGLVDPVSGFDFDLVEG